MAAQVTIQRDDGLEDDLPISYFFRSPAEFSSIEQAALKYCQGHILDIGAGTGVHSLTLQAKGLDVTAIDVSPQAVAVMRQRGVQNARCADIFTFSGGRFDTLLMMNHGIGLVQTLAGLERFLAHARNLLFEDGQVLLESLDVRRTKETVHLKYHQMLQQSGRYVGEIRNQMAFEGQSGPWFGWLHIDPEKLLEYSRACGWNCDVLLAQENGDYLAQLKGNLNPSQTANSAW